LQANI